ncbi:MAG TPA: FAD/NAD(P)-binding protein [Steroidobacteraceae bacterium]
MSLDRRRYCMQPFGAGSQDYASRCQQRIVISGAGFSGTALAILLLQRARSRSTHVVLIGREREPGRGAAYGAHRYPWLLNVPAGHMSAFQDRPDDFVEFARNRLPAVTPEDFLPRSLYGEYLQARLSEAVTQARDHVQFTFCQGEVARVARLNGSAAWRVELGDGRTLLADDVVLALGNPPPRLPPELADIANSERYVHCPWSPEAQPARASVDPRFGSHDGRCCAPSRIDQRRPRAACAVAPWPVAGGADRLPTQSPLGRCRRSDRPALHVAQ